MEPVPIPVGRLSMVVPMSADHATRYIYYPMGARGVSTGTVGPADGKVFESRVVTAVAGAWRGFVAARKGNPKLAWEDYWKPIAPKVQAYGFCGHVDLNDRNRGLLWFCDNALGWNQSKTVSAIEIERKGQQVALALNFVPEPGEYRPGRPIVFGMLPHPARPLPAAYRLFERVDPKVDPKACSIYDAFLPWPMDPRSHSMHLFPAANPKEPNAGSSWDYAESCVPTMKAAKPTGYRTMYLSKAWLGCRAGAYDNWEWRSGEMSAASLTPYFVNYLCWEMDQWIGRGIFDAIYADECYEHPCCNVEAGLSVKLPDGNDQPGVTNFAFRELMKRWRNIFTAHGKDPMIIAHQTYSWQYSGLVFCESTLDGENAPIVSLRSRDWIDSTSRERFECLQNARLWGLATFYMPFIAEGGFEDKTKSQFPRWQWRMARQAQSEFAHYETATVYEGQGGEVYKAYWRDVFRWGAQDANVPFVPYWNADPYLTVDGQGKDVLVSFYKKDGKVLLIASNRTPAWREVKIQLDRKALGLSGSPNVQPWDGSFDPPPGDDFRPAESKGPAEPGKDVMGEVGEDSGTLAVDKALTDEAADKDAAKMTPRLEGDTLVLPVRAKDFRMVSLGG